MNLFNKYFHPVNFIFADGFDGHTLSVDKQAFAFKVRHAPGIHCIEVNHSELWPHDYRCERFQMPATTVRDDDACRQALNISTRAGMQLHTNRGKNILDAEDGAWFGVSGQSWMFRFRLRPHMQFYGLGEKHVPFERSNRNYHFRNTDVWFDHPKHAAEEGDYDPDYLSIPYLIIKQQNTYIGLLADTPYPSQIGIGASISGDSQLDVALNDTPFVMIGAENGPAVLYMVHASSLAELTRTFQRLVGTTPLPPLWALGYHQCRWGYKGHDDLMYLAGKLEHLAFPADGLWLDIDYMEGYRIFTINPAHLPHAAETTAALNRRGYRVVPIIDPGVKRDPDFDIYADGKAKGLFCLNPAGTEFTGVVWPGLTVFPDFSLSRARIWWGEHVKKLLAQGFNGFWLDMNEPSTGLVSEQAMRFQEGRVEHDAYHNQYALLMARATREAMIDAKADERPFLLSRAGCTGSQRYCAHWTGDNFSSYRHLHRSIGKTINLALSGIPFNGPDVGGFGGDCSELLLIDWFKAAFLFPFMRNHSMHGSRPQEPWAYSADTLDILRHYVRLRYRLLPYLYNLFIDQEAHGEAILRPLFYDFADTHRLPLGLIDDQFMVGANLMQAPFVHETNRHREVVLPDEMWLHADTGAWIRGGGRLQVERARATTPLFLRAGGLIPFQQAVPTRNGCDLNKIGLLCCLPIDFSAQARYLYRSDDGISFQYRHGKRTVLEITAQVVGSGLHLKLRTLADGFGNIDITPYTFHQFNQLTIDTDGTQRSLRAASTSIQLTGRPLSCFRWIEN